MIVEVEKASQDREVGYSLIADHLLSSTVSAEKAELSVN
jgi:hypothetical protein